MSVKVNENVDEMVRYRADGSEDESGKEGTEVVKSEGADWCEVKGDEVPILIQKTS